MVLVPPAAALRVPASSILLPAVFVPRLWLGEKLRRLSCVTASLRAAGREGCRPCDSAEGESFGHVGREGKICSPPSVGVTASHRAMSLSPDQMDDLPPGGW